MIMYEDEHLEAAYEDRYTTAADWDAEDESNYDEIDDDEQQCEMRTGWFTGQGICTKCAPGCEHYICTEKPAYVGQHRA